MKRRYLGTIVAVILLAGLLVFAFELGREVRGREFLEDVQQRFCAETVAAMPDVIPERLFISISDEWNRTLGGQTRLAVESSLLDALAVFDFSDRVFPQFESTQIEAAGSDHAMRLVVELGRRLELMKLNGLHCSNHVVVAYTNNPGFTLHLIHELGHFFGLPHEWEDETYMGYASCLRTHAARFNLRQLEILNEWNQPGASYTPHWERVTPGSCPFFRTTLYGVPIVAILGGGFAAVIVTGALIWRGRGRE